MRESLSTRHRSIGSPTLESAEAPGWNAEGKHLVPAAKVTEGRMQTCVLLKSLFVASVP